MSNRFFIALVFIALASLQVLFKKFSELEMVRAENYTDTMKQIIYTVLILLAFSLVYYFMGSREGFFFEVPEKRTLGRNFPREAIYDDERGVTFSFDSVGSGMCSDDGCNSYGIIKGCPGARSYGRGNTDDSIL